MHNGGVVVWSKKNYPPPPTFFRRFTLGIAARKNNVDIDQGINKVKLKVALNEKRKKLHGFSFSINIAYFEAFL